MELEKWLSGFNHVHVLDFTAQGLNYDLSEFMDLVHLNEHGARRFTKELKIKLQELKLL